ncbi:MAG: DUF2520 domain-containing protein, partial [Polyangiaceae bacterium]|nr:DUF2520 domain-containing protein [Polyangiaceae bacterium]
MKLVVVGRGKVGKTLARAARHAGVEASNVSGRAPSSRTLRDAELVLLAVPDAAIAEAGSVVASLAPGAAIVHCAGALGPDALAAAAAGGASVGAMHPLVSFADAKHPPSLEGALFLIDGAPRAVALATRFARAVGARPVTQPAHGPAYHAAAALAANGAAALAFHAVELLDRLGVDRAAATSGIAALLASVAENVRTVGVPSALTGPIARGDAETVRAHRRAVAMDPAFGAAYDGVAEAVLGCAEATGLSPERSAAVRAA